MKYYRSYDGIVTLGWIFAIVFVSSLREVSLSDVASMVRLPYGVMAVALAVIVFAVYRQRMLKRRAESKVRESDLILLTDIRTLAQSNSLLLDDGIALRSAQKEQGRSPSE